MCERYLCAATNYFDASPVLNKESFPENHTTAGLAEGLAAAHEAYGSKRFGWLSTLLLIISLLSSAYVLFVVQPGERNVFDQRWLEYELLERCALTVSY